MPTLDVATLRIVSALELLILPSLLWAFLRPTPAMVAVRLWIIGGWVMALGNVLLVQRSLLTAPGGDLLIRLVFVIYLLLRIQSLRMDLGIPHAVRTLFLSLVAYVCMHEVVRHLFPGRLGLLIMTSTVTTLLTTVLAGLVLRIARIEGSRGAIWLVVGLAVYAVLFFARVVALATGHTPLDQLGSSAIADAIAIAIVLVPIVEHMGYLGICIERSRRTESTAVTKLSVQLELDALRQQIAVLDRRRSLGEMAAMLGHEVKQPLTAVLTSAQAAQLGVEHGQLSADQIQALLDRIANGARRANGLIERITRFVRPSPLTLQNIDLNEVVREALALSPAQLGESGISAKFLPTPSPLIVNGDSLLLSQVVLNLIRNSIEAPGCDRALTISCSTDGVTGVVTVRDNGLGFASAALDNFGVAFYSTKPGGLGMGLAVSNSIVRQHGGSLHANNLPHGGACVEMRLPLHGSESTD